MVPFLIALALVPAAFSQTHPAKKAAPIKQESKQGSWPLVSLSVKGNHIYTEQQVLEVSGLKLGEIAGNAQFQAAHDRLLATGAFGNVGFQFGPDAAGKGIAGTIAVEEVEQLYPYRFEDLPASDAELRAFVRKYEPLFAAKMTGTQEVVDRISKELQQSLADKNLKYPIHGEFVADAPGQLAVVFRPATPRAQIGEVHFTGSKVILPQVLQGAFAPLAVGTPYSELNFRQKLDSGIRPLYEAKGRMRVAFGKIEAKPLAHADGVSITIAVDEGPEFKMGNVMATKSAIPAKELQAALKSIRGGEVANFDTVRAAVDAIQAIYRDEGYIRSETRFVPEIHDQEKTVDVHFTTTPGPLFHMGKLSIEGLDVTTEPAIRKLWSLTAGKPFKASYPQFFLDRVKEEGYLENVKDTRYEQHIDGDTQIVDVTLFFTGGSDKQTEEKKRKQQGQQ
jgi:outer membrane protein insertion porin family